MITSETLIVIVLCRLALNIQSWLFQPRRHHVNRQLAWILLLHVQAAIVVAFATWTVIIVVDIMISIWWMHKLALTNLTALADLSRMRIMDNGIRLAGWRNELYLTRRLELSNFDEICTIKFFAICRWWLVRLPILWTCCLMSSTRNWLHLFRLKTSRDWSIWVHSYRVCLLCRDHESFWLVILMMVVVRRALHFFVSRIDSDAIVIERSGSPLILFFQILVRFERVFRLLVSGRF